MITFFNRERDNKNACNQRTVLLSELGDAALGLAMKTDLLDCRKVP
jgi:hypothetical protein